MKNVSFQRILWEFQEDNEIYGLLIWGDGKVEGTFWYLLDFNGIWMVFMGIYGICRAWFYLLEFVGFWLDFMKSLSVWVDFMEYVGFELDWLSFVEF